MCRGVIVLLHGLNEHRFVMCFLKHICIKLSYNFFYNILCMLLLCSGRYSNFAKQLNANGFKVIGIDWIGEFNKFIS